MATKVGKLLVLVGQTASGKSALAIELAEKFNGEIICADSRTIYREADIGTAKPGIKDQKRIRHHLLDIETIGEPFSVAEFKRLAQEAIKDIASRGKLPILVGGSGLYIDAVMYDYDFRQSVDNTVRDKYKDSSVEELQSELRTRNIELPENSRNRRYLIRSLEAGGQSKRNERIRDDTMIIGLDVDVETLKIRSQKRAQQMLDDGIIDEINQLQSNHGWDNAVMKAPAYVAFRELNERNCTVSEAIDECVKLDLKLAKKQRTWFKRNKSIHWVTASKAHTLVQDFLRK